MKTKTLFVLILFSAFLVRCTDGKKEKEAAKIRKILSAIELQSKVIRPLGEISSLLAGKYKVGDSLCKILNYSYYKHLTELKSLTNSAFNSTLIKIDSSEIHYRGISGEGMRRFIETASLKLKIEKNIIASIIFDLIVLRKDQYHQSSIIGYSILLSEKYILSDTLCEIIIKSYLIVSGVHLNRGVNRWDESLIDSSQLIRTKSSGILYRGLSGQEMNEFIEKSSLKLNIEKRLVSSVLYDFILLYGLNKMEE
jgi:hypothetical protein